MKNKKALVFLLILLVIFLPISPNNIFGLFSYADVDDDGSITGIEVWDQDKTINSEYTVEPGATLIIKPGVTITFQWGSIDVKGSMFVNGTLLNPVIFKKGTGWNYYITVEESGKLVVKNADISGAGLGYQMLRKNTVMSKALAGVNKGGIDVKGGWLDVEGSDIHDCDIPFNIENKNLDRIKVNRNKIHNNKHVDVYYWGTSGDNVNFEYNWWGNSEAPTEDRFSVPVDSSNYLKQEYFHDPVIIVPGILCSWQLVDNGDWEMDPIFKTYDSLYETFENNGYEEGKDLFTFPYQWRASNVDTAKLLEEKIQEIKEKNNWPKVDLVAHSMGGLVARQYIESDDYNGDVDQLVMLGTPNNGAPEDYLIWEGGELSTSKFDIVGLIIDKIFKQEAKENKFDSIFDYLHNAPIKSVQELLPAYDYLYDASYNKLRSYRDGEHYPINSFIDNLNLADNLQRLNNVSIINISGKLNREGTIGEIKVGKPSFDIDSQWADGELIEDGLFYTSGDGTVPLVSSRSILSDEQIEINSEHMRLPSSAQNIVFNNLNGYFPQEEIPFAGTNKRIFFFALSPIDIQIIAPDKKHWIGKNIKNLDEKDQIEGAFYTGYETENEFATIPNPVDGEYQIITEGTGDGNYTVEVTNISEDEETGQASESTAELKGTAEKDTVKEATVTVSDKEVTTKTVDNIPPTIIAKASPEPNENSWNNTDVTVHFDASDDSGIKSITPNVTIAKEGKDQEVKGEAEDNAGNKNETIIKVSIDKTRPETSAKIFGTKGDNDWHISPIIIEFSAADNLSGIENNYYSIDDSDFQIGNELIISADGDHQIKYYSTDLAGNQENEKSLEIKIDPIMPTIKIISPENKNYQNAVMLPIRYEASDNMTDKENLKTKISYDGNITNKSYLDLSLEHLGSHVISFVAIDAAGNRSEEVKAGFQIMTSIDSIAKNISHYYSLGLIRKRTTELFLGIKVRNIKETMRLLDTFQSKWMPQWAKERVIENLKYEINRQIDYLERKLERDRNLLNNVDEKVREILLEDLEAIKI